MKLILIPSKGNKLVDYLGQCLEVPEYTTHIAVDSDGELWAYDNEPDNPIVSSSGVGWWCEECKDGYEMRFDRIDTRLTLEDASDNWQQSVRAAKPWIKFPKALYAITVVACDGDEEAGLAMYSDLEPFMHHDTLEVGHMFVWSDTPQGQSYWAGIARDSHDFDLEEGYHCSLI